MFDPLRSDRWGYAVSAMGTSLIGASLLYVALSYGSVVADVMEVGVPVAVATALVAFGVRLRRDHDGDVRGRRVATWSALGTLAAGLVGSWWVVVHATRGSPVAGLTDQILTLVSLGVGAGAVVGARVDRPEPSRFPQPAADRSAVVAETTWVRRGGLDAVTTAIAEAIADAEEVDPVDVDLLLFDHVDPDALELLATHDGSPWQLTFHTDRYEVRVSGYGTVTVFDRRERSHPDPETA